MPIAVGSKAPEFTLKTKAADGLAVGEGPPAPEGRATPPALTGPEEPEPANGRSRRKKAAAE